MPVGYVVEDSKPLTQWSPNPLSRSRFHYNRPSMPSTPDKPNPYEPPNSDRCRNHGDSPRNPESNVFAYIAFALVLLAALSAISWLFDFFFQIPIRG